MTWFSKPLLGAFLVLLGLLAGSVWYALRQRDQVVALTGQLTQARTAIRVASQVAASHQKRAQALDQVRLKETYVLDKQIALEPNWGSQPVPPGVVDALGLRDHSGDVSPTGGVPAAVPGPTPDSGG